MLESRIALSAGLTLSGALPNPWNQLYDLNNQPVVSTTDYRVGQYAAPGTNPFVSLDTGGDINLPYTINGSPSFNQPVQTSDWWSNLMLRIDPTSRDNPDGTFNYAYTNAILNAEPALLRFQNSRFTDDTSAWIQGLSVSNPGSLGIDPTPTGPNETTKRDISYLPLNLPLTIGVGGNTSTNTDTPAGEITPLGTAGNRPSNGVDESKLNVRVNQYSDWGVEVTYGDGNPDAPINLATGQPTGRTNALTMDLLNGSPFLYFNKWSAGASTNAFAKVWLRGAGVPGTEPAGALNVVWGRDLPGQPAPPPNLQLPNNVLAVTLTTNDLDASGALRTNTSSYLVVAPTSTNWSLSNQGNPDGNYHPQNPQLWTNPMASGAITVVLMPDFVGNTRFEALSQADQVSVAKLFLQVASNVPNPSPSVPTTEVSDPTTGFSATTGQLTTTYTINTTDNKPTYQLLYPHHYNNLVAADQNSFLKFTPTSGIDFGKSVELSFNTLLGKARVYSGNSFTTQLQYQGLLDHLPSLAAQTDATAARVLYEAAASYMQRYIADPNYAVGITDNTYDTGLMLLSQTLQDVDALASPASLLTPDQHEQATLWRDRLLQGLETELATWFDVSTGRFFQLNTTYDTVIGYPAGFGSDFGVNDHHFHYGYFLSSFATVGQFDPAFVQAYLPQITLLVRDVANVDRTATDLPFLREFNPWAGHSWADGLGVGGNNEESASESVNFSAALIRLGQLLNNPAWVSQGVYQYETEIDAMNQYWFNVDADPASGNFGNYQPEYARYVSNGQINYVTQIANVNQLALKRGLFFDSPNYAEAVYAINWLPTASWMLFLGANQDYLQRNWAQFVRDSNIDGRNGVNQAVVAGYQALLPDQGFGLNQPGATNALLRLDADQNPAFVPTSQTDPGFKGGYLGTNRFVALNWTYAMQELGQVDYSVIADTPSYGVFVKDGQRTYVATNYTTAPLTVTFRDKLSNVVLQTMIVQPGQTLTMLPDGSLEIDANAVSQVSLGTSLYLTKPANQDPNTPAGLTLSRTIGTTTPTAITPANPTQRDILASYNGTFTQVPKRPGDATNIGPQAPDASGIVAFSLTGINGAYNGGDTGLQLFLNNALTRRDDPTNPADKPFGDEYGPGVLINDALGRPEAIIEVRYSFNGDSSQDRVETYSAMLSGVNQFNLYENLTPNPGVLDPNVPRDGALTLLEGLSQLRPFQDMANGSVTVRMWQGPWSTTDLSHKEFSVSVNADPALARSSRIVIPFTDNTVGPTVLQIDPVAQTKVRSGQPVTSVKVHLSQAAVPGTFTTASLSLRYNGTAVALDPQTVTITQDATDPRAYTISGLGASQTQAGQYVLTVNGALIKNATSPAGSGVESVNWVIDNTAPTLQLSSSSPATTPASPIIVTALFSEPVVGFVAADVRVTNGTLSNFRGVGSIYAFDVVPNGPRQTVTVSVPAGATQDSAGNKSTAASLVRVSTITGPTATMTSTANAVTNLTSIPVMVQFSTAVTGLTVADFVVRNATISGFPTGSTGTTYSFNLVPTGAGVVTLDLPGGVVVDAHNRGNAAAATLRRTFDPSGPTGVLTSIANYLTYDATIPVVLVLNESVTGFTASDITVTNGTVANFQGSGSRYTFDLVARDLGVVSASIGAGAFRDAAGNTNAALPTLSRNYRIIPTASVTTTVQTPTNATTIPIQIAFNQAMTFANFASAVQLVNATLGSVTSIDGATYTFNITPTNSDSSQKAYPVSVILQANTARDAYGNGNPLARLDLFYGSTPKVTSLTENMPPGQFFYNVAIAFDQNVVGLDATKLTASNATITDVTGGGNLWNFMLTPKPSRSDYNNTMTIQVQIADGAIVSAAGIPYKNDPMNPIPSFTTFTITGPTLVLSSPVLSKTFEAPIPVTAKFSEAVQGFTAGNFNLGNATIVPRSFVPDPKDASRYTFDLLPNAGYRGNVFALANVANVMTLDNQFTAMNSPSGFNRIIASPVVTSLTSTLADGTYGVGQVIPIQLTYSDKVQVSGTPILTLNAGSRDADGLDRHDANAIYSSISADGKTLTFLYTVEQGQNSAPLDADSNSAITLPGGALIKDGMGVVLPGDQLNVPAHAAAGSLGFNKTIVINTSATTQVVSVTSTLPNGTYAAGQLIPIQVKFSRPVVVTGAPDLVLALGAATERASFAGGSGTDTLTFNYLVGDNQRSLRLDYTSTMALDLNGGTILDPANNPISLALPTPGGPGSLSFNKAIAVSSVAPRILAVSSPSPSNTTFGPTQTVQILVNFDVAVNVVSGTPTLALNSGGTASYTSGAGTNQLLFTYTVEAGQQTSSLDVASTTALTGGTIEDQAKNAADRTLPAPGTAGSLSNASDNRNLKIAGVAPKILSVFADVNGTRQNGSGFQIYVKFSDTVILGSGMSMPTLALNNGDFATFSGIVSDGKGAGNTLIFNYIPFDALNNTTTAGSQTASATTINVASAAGFAASGFVQVQGSSGLLVFRYTGLTATSFTGCTLVSGNASDTIADRSKLSSFVDVAKLDVANVANPIDLAGRTLMDAGGNTADLTIPASSTLGVNNRITIKTQYATAPQVTSITSQFVQGTFGVGAIIPITVTFTQPVIVTQLPQITLNSGGTAFYTGGSGTRTLRFSYLVRPGENIALLDASGVSALTVPGGTIRNIFSPYTDADLSLPAPGAVGSLGYNTRFVIDTTTQTAPSVVAVGSPMVAGTYRPGQQIQITVVFDRAVVVTPSVAGGVPFMQLNAGTTAKAVYTSGSGSNTLTFTYTVKTGDMSALLDYTTSMSLRLNGAKIRDKVNRKDALLTLATPGLADSLSASDLLFVASTPTRRPR